MSKIYTVTDAQAKFSEVIDSVLQGKEKQSLEWTNLLLKFRFMNQQQENNRLGLMQDPPTIPNDFDTWDSKKANCSSIH